VYPQCINKQWNDGREFKESIAANDDVQFINQLLDTLQQQLPLTKSGYSLPVYPMAASFLSIFSLQIK